MTTRNVTDSKVKVAPGLVLSVHSCQTQDKSYVVIAGNFAGYGDGRITIYRGEIAALLARLERVAAEMEIKTHADELRRACVALLSVIDSIKDGGKVENHWLVIETARQTLTKAEQ